MPWKKIIPFISCAMIIGAISSNFVSVNIGDQNGYVFLSKLKNFDWTNDVLGDGLEYNNNNLGNKITDDNGAVAGGAILNAINSGESSKPIKSSNKGSFLDYLKFNTSFKSTDSIKKQAVTGVPLDWGFMPNGNKMSDFGVTSRAQKYSTINSILDWNPDMDRDSRFNKSYTPMRKSTQTAFFNPNKTVEMNFDYLGHSTRSHSTFDNSIVGTRNPFTGTNLNWQYTSNFVNWEGSTSEGIIVPPPGDMIDMAHNNGVSIYGNIFLDGYHGLSKEKLRDFVKKDSDGNYPAVDFLLNIAKYSGFDGYFLNDETNGSDPNGTVLDFDTLLDMVKQFNKKSVEYNLNKKIIYYNSDSNLSYENGEPIDKQTFAMTKTMPNNEPSDIQLSFGYSPDSSEAFLEKYSNYKRKNIYTISDTTSRDYSFGTYDWRQMGYEATSYDSKKKKMKYNNKVYSSMSGYMDDGAASFGNEALKIVDKNTNNDLYDNERAFLFANQVSNLYNDIFFNGINTNQSADDEGLELNGFDNDYINLIHDSGNMKYELILDDPRINFDGKGNLKHTEAAADVDKEIYNYADNDGINTNSYGVGNVIQEKTVFEDQDNNIGPIKTDFSTGSGIKFVDRDENNNPLITSDYPYTNRRIADILPTYQWDINEVPKNSVLSQLDILKTKKTKITELNGFYDYDDAYLKSNSIALGKSFNGEGQINPGVWDKDNKYIWNIIGTNISNSNHTFSFTYKDNDDAQVKPVLTTTNGESNKYVEVNNFKVGNTTKDGWKTISFSLKDSGAGISKETKLSKIGLLITPKENTFKFNVGEFVMDGKTTLNNSKIASDQISNFVNEYRIERDNLINLRFTYEAKPDFDYIEFYIKNKKEGKWLRVGETTANEYFIKDIDKSIFGDSIELAAITYKNNQIIGSNKYDIN